MSLVEEFTTELLPLLKFVEDKRHPEQKCYEARYEAWNIFEVGVQRFFAKPFSNFSGRAVDFF